MNKLLLTFLAAFVCFHLVNSQVQPVGPPYFPTVDQLESQGFNSALFQVSASLIYAINQGRKDPQWMANTIAQNFSRFSDDYPSDLLLNTTDYDQFDAPSYYYTTIEGINASNDSVAFFQNLSNQTKQPLYQSNMGLMWSAQVRANYLVWKMYEDNMYNAMNSSYAQALVNLSSIGDITVTTSFQEFLVYSCESVSYSFFPLWWKIFTSDGDNTTRYVRNGVYNNSNTQFGIGIAALQKGVYLDWANTTYCSSGGAMVVIHVANAFNCSSTCPILPYPMAYDTSDVYNNLQKAIDWTNYWTWFWGNYTNTTSPWVSLNITWNFTSMALGFQANLLGAVNAASLPPGSYSWSIIDYQNTQSGQDILWFLNNVWNKYVTTYPKMFIPTYLLTNVTTLGVTCKYQATNINYTITATTGIDYDLDYNTRHNAINCGNNCFPVVGPNTPHYFTSASDFDNCFRGINTESQCLNDINQALSDLSGTIMFDSMFAFNLIQTARQTPAAVKNLTNGTMTFNGNVMKVSISSVPFPVPINTTGGQTTLNNFLTFTASQPSDFGYRLHYPLLISAQSRANMIVANAAFNTTTPNNSAVQIILNDLNALGDQHAAYAEVIIHTCDDNLLSEVFDVPFQALTSDGDASKYSQGVLFNNTYDSFGIGMAYWNFSTANSCFPKVTVMHVATHVDCANQTCSNTVPAPSTGNFDLSIYDVNFEGWDFMWQQIIQNNVDYYAGMNIMWEINEQTVDQLKIKAVFYETPNVNTSGGYYSWSVTDVQTTNGAYMTGLYFFQTILAAANLTVNQTLNMSELVIPTKALQNIYSFNMYCSWWNDTNFNIKTVAPTPIQLWSMNLPYTYPTDINITRTSPESQPKYKNLVLQASTFYPNSQYQWTVPGASNVLSGVPSTASTLTIPPANFPWGQTVTIICTYTAVNLTDPTKTVGGSNNINITFYDLQNPSFTATTDTTNNLLNLTWTGYQDSDGSDDMVLIMSPQDANAFYFSLLEGSDINDASDSGFVSTVLPIVPNTTNLVAQLTKKKNPNLMIPTNFSVTATPNFTSIPINISTTPKTHAQFWQQASNFVNNIGARKLKNGGAFLAPPSIDVTQSCPVSCGQGKCVKISDVSVWQIQKFYCQCDTGYMGANCDLTLDDQADYINGVVNMTQALNFWLGKGNKNMQMLYKVYSLFFLATFSEVSSTMGILEPNSIGNLTQAINNITQTLPYPGLVQIGMLSIVGMWKSGGQPFPTALASQQLSDLALLDTYSSWNVKNSFLSNYNPFSANNQTGVSTAVTYLNPLDIFTVAKGYGYIPASQISTITTSPFDGTINGYLNIQQVPTNLASVFFPQSIFMNVSYSPVASITQYHPMLYSPYLNSTQLVSYIYDVSVYDLTTGNLQNISSGLSASKPVIVNIPVWNTGKITIDPTTYTCVWFNRATSKFVSDGCLTAPSDEGYVMCQCTHLTHFGLTANATDPTPNPNPVSGSMLMVSLSLLVMIALAILL